MHLNIPLVLHNTGPAQMVVRDFRLRLAAPADGGEPTDAPMVMSWSARQGQLEPSGRSPDGEREGTRSMPAPFTVDGRRVEVAFIEFTKDRPSLDMLAGPLVATVLVKLARRAWWDRLLRPDDDEGWAPLLTFTLNTQLSRAEAGAYITRTNDPDWSA